MKLYHNVSPQNVSWVKSNKAEFESCGGTIKNLYYPETIEELVNLVNCLNSSKERFDIIGYSSNTLFLPTYSINHLICTKTLDKWLELDDSIICQCGVNVSRLSKQMVLKGYAGFEGLIDLPGTIAGGVYGNAGCRKCSINELVESVSLLDENKRIIEIIVDDLKLQYRSSALKRKELNGIILNVRLRKQIGNREELERKAAENHIIRTMEQPSPSNNLGTTFLGNVLSRKGAFLFKIESYIKKIIGTKDSRKTFPVLLKLIGKGKYAPYVYYWNRYMFIDERSHLLFPEYKSFLSTIFLDLSLEIEVRE